MKYQSIAPRIILMNKKKNKAENKIVLILAKMKEKLHFPLVLLLIIFFTACADQENQQAKPPKPNHIVLMFDNMPVNSRYKWKAGHTSGFSPRHEIRYIDDHSIIQHLNPDYAPEKDTIVIKSTRNVLEVQHTYKGIDHLSYRFQNGDSVLFTYNGKKPFAKVLNREVSDIEVNYDINKREKLSNDYFPGMLRTHRSFALTEEFDSIPWERKAEVAKEVGINAALKEFDAEGVWLDSLYQNKLISKEAFDFYYTNRNMEMANAQFDTNFGFGLNAIDGISKVLTPEQLMALNLDTVSSRFYYQKMLEEKRREWFTSKVDLIRHSNGSYWDSRQAYDLINNNDAIRQLEKDLMLVKTMSEIYDNFDLDDRIKYWEKFQKDISDAVYLNFLKEKYSFGEPIKDEVELVAFNGEETTLSQALEKYRGKVIYVDFWASWCAPCIRTFPDAKKLQQEYEGQDVVFMYLSIDEEADKWKKASQEHSLYGITPGYWITNKKRSRNMDYLNVRLIPRYMIYDRTGSLVEGDAPRPGTKEIRQVIDQYL